MGNLVSSCTTGSVLRSPKCAARVLLVDGSALKFTAPISASKLLAEYPNHVICALASLKPGLHALSSLLPDEKLQMGRLYLLLPLKAHTQKAPPAPQKNQEAPKNVPAQKKTTVGAHMSGKAPTKKCDVGSSSGAPCRRNGDVGPRESACAGKTTKNGEVGRLQEGEAQALGREMLPVGRPDGRRRRREKWRGGEVQVEREMASGEETGNGRSRPVRPVNRPGFVRRSVSWAPRLQPITEKR